MNKIIKNLFWLALITILSFFIINYKETPFNNVVGLNPAYTAVQSNEAQKTFLEAWVDLKNEYLDPTMNQQDWKKWQDRYINVIQSKPDAYVAIDSMIQSLNDPYTRFLPPSEFAEQTRGIDATVQGIGVHIGAPNGKPQVIDVIEKTPAQEAGLKAGDIILKVNAKSTSGLSLDDVAEIIRGKAGTSVTLTIKRGNSILIKKVQRREIHINNVEYKMLTPDIAYIKISSFLSQDASKEMLEALSKTNASKGIIIDVRGNFGGLLQNAVIISNLFMDKGTIVSTVDRNGEKEVIKAESFMKITNKPIILLVNGASASASEILSGALKDNNRAILVGEKTYGKGLVQRIIELKDGSGINVTIAKYLTPNGTDINKKGIEPNYKVAYTEKDFYQKKDPQLDKAKQLIEEEIKK
ncbi:MAG: S41 family peptidase [bacterium]